MNTIVDAVAAALVAPIFSTASVIETAWTIVALVGLLWSGTAVAWARLDRDALNEQSARIGRRIPVLDRIAQENLRVEWSRSAVLVCCLIAGVAAMLTPPRPPDSGGTFAGAVVGISFIVIELIVTYSAGQAIDFKRALWRMVGNLEEVERQAAIRGGRRATDRFSASDAVAE